MRSKRRIALFLAIIIALMGLIHVFGEGLEVEYEPVMPAPEEGVSEEDAASPDVERSPRELDAFNLMPESDADPVPKPSGPVKAAARRLASYAPGGNGDNDSLFVGYVDRLFMGRGLARMKAPIAPRLSDPVASVCYILKERVNSVVGGELESTKFAVPLGAVGLATWTASDLGVSEIADEDGNVTDAAYDAFIAKLVAVLDLKQLLAALRSDCPFELFWYDKTVNTTMGIGGAIPTATRVDGEWVMRVDDALYFDLPVAAEYAVEDSTEPVDDETGVYASFTVDTAKLSLVQTAAANAQAVVTDNAALSDLGKLDAYRQYICDSVTYNSAAAGNAAMPYGNPWQLIWVFDEKPETNVVCEGYAKAFQYLCDMSDFDGGVSCYSVIGKIPAGNHMWNIVTMDNDRNYLVDVTNCDGGMASSPDKPFLVGCVSGSPSSGYTAAYGGGTTYTYDETTILAFPEALRTLSGSDYADDIEASAHRWSAPRYTWADGNGAVTAERHCLIEHCDALQTETAEATYRVTREPTCTEPGDAVWASDAFDNPAFLAQTRKVTVPSTGHRMVIDAAVEPTCTEAGLTEGKHCAACGFVETARQTVPANGHTPAIDAAVEPTCTEAGLTEGAHCAVCGFVEIAQRTVPAYGHTPAIDAAVEPTCTQAGLTEGAHCSVCGIELRAQAPIAPPGHDWGDPTYAWADDYGSVTARRACKRAGCGGVETETVRTTSRITRTASYTARGKMTYTATFTNAGFAAQSKTIDSIPTLSPTFTPTPSPAPAVTPTPTAPSPLAPTITPTIEPTPMPTPTPTVEPSAEPTPGPTVEPTPEPTPTPAPAIRISKCDIEVMDQVYTGKAIKPTVVVKYRDATLKKKRDYTVSWGNNIDVGKATATVIGKGRYTGTKKISFAINPRAVKLEKLTAGRNQFTASWTRAKAQVDGYQIEYGTKKDFSDGKTVSVKGGDSTGKAVKKLKGKTKYYARVRAYRKVGKKTYWSAWSKAKGVKVK